MRSLLTREAILNFQSYFFLNLVYILCARLSPAIACTVESEHVPKLSDFLALYTTDTRMFVINFPNKNDFPFLYIKIIFILPPFSPSSCSNVLSLTAAVHASSLSCTSLSQIHQYLLFKVKSCGRSIYQNLLSKTSRCSYGQIASLICWLFGLVETLFLPGVFKVI